MEFVIAFIIGLIAVIAIINGIIEYTKNNQEHTDWHARFVDASNVFFLTLFVLLVISAFSFFFVFGVLTVFGIITL